MAASEPNKRLPTDRVLGVALGKLVQKVDGLLKELRPFGCLAWLVVGLSLLQQINAELQLGLEPCLGERLLLGLSLRGGLGRVGSELSVNLGSRGLELSPGFFKLGAGA